MMLLFCLLFLYFVGSYPALKWMRGEWFRSPYRRGRLMRYTIYPLCSFYGLGAFILSFFLSDEDLD